MNMPKRELTKAVYICNSVMSQQTKFQSFPSIFIKKNTKDLGALTGFSYGFLLDSKPWL
jgi:hypothetical protein